MLYKAKVVLTGPACNSGNGSVITQLLKMVIVSSLTLRDDTKLLKCAVPWERALFGNLLPRVFSLSNMAAAGEKTLAHSELKRSLIGAFHYSFIRALSLVYAFRKEDGYPLRAS